MSATLPKKTSAIVRRLAQAGIGCISPAGPRARLSIVIFHRVLSAPDPLFPGEVDRERFDAICGWLAAWFNVLPLAEAVRQLHSGSLPARALAITFDDGYADNHDVALPILTRHGLPATFFVATGFLDGGIMWNDQVVESLRNTKHSALDLGACGVPGVGRLPLRTHADRRTAIDAVLPAIKYMSKSERLDRANRITTAATAETPRNLMMTSSQVRAMFRAGQAIGAHTVSHPILATLDDSVAAMEIDQSRARLEDVLQDRVGLFAYPNGRPGRDYTPATVRLVQRAGFDAAVTTSAGAGRGNSDLFQLPRFTPWDVTPGRFAMRLTANLSKLPQLA